VPSLTTLAQAGAAAVVAARLAPGRDRRGPLRPDAAPAPAGSVSVVVPARDEAERLPACLDGLMADGDLHEVVVVDDESMDATAAVAEAAGARVVRGRPLPPGWRGKTWALEQGLEAAAGDWVLFLDADTRPRPGLARALVALAEREAVDVLSGGPRFQCDGALEQALHAGMLATLPYRFGPADVPGRQPSPGRALLNGQCVLVRRRAFAAAGGWGRVRGHLTEDVALAGALRREGARIAFADAGELLSVRMYGSAAETWAGWPRSLMAADALGPPRVAGDLAVLWLCVGLPALRLLTGRTTPLDRALLVLRLALHAALRGSYARRGAGFWLAPLTDPAVCARLTWSVLRPARSWRGRDYA
jgi:dolichol-phosphate mannosyltransferase